MEAMDGSSGSEDDPVALRELRRRKKGPAHRDTSSITAGMVVAHSTSDISATEGTILTLKDKGILKEDGNDLDLDDIDELERFVFFRVRK